MLRNATCTYHRLDHHTRMPIFIASFVLLGLRESGLRGLTALLLGTNLRKTEQVPLCLLCSL
jgi:hypothetical protein